MTDHSSLWQSPEMSRKLAKRYASERRFKWVGVVAIVLSLSFLAFLIFTMVANGASGIDLAFLTNSDSTDPATAGVWGAFKGSLLTMGVTLALSFPMGVLAADLSDGASDEQRSGRGSLRVGIHRLGDPGDRL